jgi:hypothetical protein
MKWVVDYIPVLCLRCSWPNRCRDEIDTVNSENESDHIWACRYGCTCHQERIPRMVGVISALALAIHHMRCDQEVRRLREGRR